MDKQTDTRTNAGKNLPLQRLSVWVMIEDGRDGTWRNVAVFIALQHTH